MHPLSLVHLSYVIVFTRQQELHDMSDEEHAKQHEEAEFQRQMMDDLREICEKKDKAVGLMD